MRTRIEIDDVILNEALILTNSKTKKEVVEVALRALIDKIKRQQMLMFKGKINWEGNLDELRSL